MGSTGNPARVCSLVGNTPVWSSNYTGRRCIGRFSLSSCPSLSSFFSMVSLLDGISENCPDAVIDFAHFVATPVGQARQGLCLAGYDGFPVVRCVEQVFDVGVWDSAVEGYLVQVRFFFLFSLFSFFPFLFLLLLTPWISLLTVVDDGSAHSGRIAGGILGTIAGLFLLAMLILFIVKRRHLIKGTNESFFPLEEIRNNLSS